ncbi:MAG: peptidyl-prolyl cis-trans isomerase [Verrucomicrobiota bacterium]|nr:peptidyl-prolyl cis-trans isomerase [Verrucomicrobiota bacterium]MDP7050134.1 peptidyl-prolyl cis-trans isomerase [Verrucomicrobiota bacterium]
MKSFLSWFPVACAAVLLAHASLGQSTSAHRNSIVAEVNDKIITRHMVDLAMRKEEEHLRREYARQPQVYGQKYTQLQAETLERLIRRELMLLEYQEKGFKLPESIIDQRIKEDIRAEYGNRATLIKSLQVSNMTYEEFARLQREMIIQMVMINQFVSKANIVISPRQIEKHYVANKDAFRTGIEIRLRVIFLDAKKHGGAKSTRKLADEIHTILLSGESFAGIASVYSDQNQASRGLKPDWVKRGDLASELDQAAFALGQGQFSPVVELPHGCYLLRCEEVSQAKLRGLTEVRDQIEQTLIEAEQQAREDKWYDRLKRKSHVRQFSF